MRRGDRRTELAERIALFAVVMNTRQPGALLDGFSELVRDDAQRMLATVKAWPSATRQARVAVELGPRADAHERVAALLSEARPALRAAIHAQLPPALAARFAHLVDAASAAPGMKSLAARLVRETTR